MREGGFARIDDVNLRAEFEVPKEMIGRIIGKKGQNVSITILEFEHLNYFTENFKGKHV